MAVIFNSEDRHLINGDNIFELSRQQADCLSLLMEAEGSLLSGKEILRRCWTEKGLIVGDSSVRVALYQLRKQLALAGLPDNILVTEVGSGYRLKTGYLRPVAAGGHADAGPENRPCQHSPTEPVSSAVPVEKRRQHSVSAIMKWGAFLIILLVITLAAGWFRLSTLSTPLHYTSLPGQTATHILVQEGVKVDAERVEHIYNGVAANAPEGFSSPWIYVHRSLHEANLTALVCDRSITTSGKVCYSLHYEEEK